MSENKSDLFLSAGKYLYNYCHKYVKEKNFEIDVNHWSSNTDKRIEKNRSVPSHKNIKKRQRW
ncbi:MAG: hypothetical protein JW769_01600 [Parachlamydiales bacterium]|nr:hypothetical protein [Parachlamydiales bacterium]